MLQRLPLAAVGPMLMRRRGALRPTLALNFLAQALQGAFGTLDPRVSFSRGSSATRINAQGLVETVGSDVPRFQFDAVTLQPLGLLVEEQRTNLLTWSEAFENATWTKSNATVTASAGVAPDGTPSARKLVETATTSLHGFNSTAFVAGTYTISVYAKAAERSRVFVGTFSGATISRGFDLSTGSDFAITGATTPTASSITPVGNGWYRCSVTVTTTGSDNVLICSLTGSALSYAGDGTSGVLLWGAQLEAGAFATTYIPTFGATATRAADQPTLPLANIPGWSASAGALVAGFTTPTFPTPNARRVIGSDAALSAAPIELSGSRARSWNGSVSLATADGPSWATAARRAALAWDPAGRALVYAGGAVVTDANQPAFGTTLRLGYEDVNANMLNGVIKSIDYYPQRLPNATLQQLTTA